MDKLIDGINRTYEQGGGVDRGGKEEEEEKGGGGVRIEKA